MRAQARRRKRIPFKVRLWDFLTLETQMALVKAGLVDPANVDIKEDRSGLRLILVGETTDELERLMKGPPTGPYAAFISGGPARPATNEDDNEA